MARWGVLVMIVLTILVGCVMRPTSVTPGSYTFIYTPPQATSKPLPVTIALVRPSAADPAAFLQSPKTVQEAGNAFASSMKADLEKMLVAKGGKVTGPYDSVDVMTFPDKQTASLTLTPVIDVRASQQATDRTGTGSPIFPAREEGVYVVSGWISLVMLEPLTGEKMWIKKIDIAPVQEPYVLEYVGQRSGPQVLRRVINDTRGNALAAALSKTYPEVMQKAWDYCHPDEVLQVKRQAEEARKLKRF